MIVNLHITIVIYHHNTMSVEIRYTIHGDLDERGTVCSCLAQLPLTNRNVQMLFPFQGEFRFRLQRKGIAYGIKTDYIWLDISSDYGIIDVGEYETIIVQVLVLSFPSISEKDEDVTFLESYDSAISNTIIDSVNRPMRDVMLESKKMISPIQSGIQGISVESVTKNAASIWSSVLNTAAQFQFVGHSPVHQETFGHLYTLLNTNFDERNERHLQLLSDLWNGLFPGVPFQREGLLWRHAGWQKADPIADLKSSGLLALLAMRYLSANYSGSTQRMILSNKENIKTNYPFAVVGINLTLLLVDVLGIKDKKFVSLLFFFSFTFSNRYLTPPPPPDGNVATSFDMFSEENVFYEVIAFVGVRRI